MDIALATNITQSIRTLLQGPDDPALAIRMRNIIIDKLAAAETVPPIQDIGYAMAALKAGKRVAREGWNGKGMYLELQVPDSHSKMTLSYVYMKTADNQLVPWLCSQSDLLAEDWVILD